MDSTAGFIIRDASDGRHFRSRKFLAVPLVNESSRDLRGLLLLTASPLFQLAQR